MNTPINRLRCISALEGITYVILVFIAMPMNYLFNDPLLLQTSGMAYALLFMLFAMSWLDVVRRHGMSKFEALVVLLWSFVPMGFLPIEDRLRRKRNRPLC